MSEANGAIGSRPDGAFGALRTGTILTGLTASRRLSGNWTLLGSLHAGVHRTDNRRQGIVRGVSGLRSGAFALGVIGQDVGRSGDRLAFRLSQPLRVEAGRAQLRWVSGRSPDGQVELQQADLSLEPSGRQLDLEVASLASLGGRAGAHGRNRLARRGTRGRRTRGLDRRALQPAVLEAADPVDTLNKGRRRTIRCLRDRLCCSRRQPTANFAVQHHPGHPKERRAQLCVRVFKLDQRGLSAAPSSPAAGRWRSAMSRHERL